MEKLDFTVCHYSGEDVDYKAIELNEHTPQTKGWQSSRFCEYPQEIGFMLIGSSSAPYLNQLQILSHQSKIASKMEVYLGKGGDSYHSAEFVRLGSLALDPNERSSFQARELKTVYIDKPTVYIRLVIHHCHINKYNLFNQVGIVAINMLGQPNYIDRGVPGVENEVDEFGRSFDKRIQDEEEKEVGKELYIELTIETGTAEKLRLLNNAKTDAVEEENFKLAKQIKETSVNVQKIGVRLAELDTTKKNAVEKEDYERAAEVKQEMDGLKRQVDAMVGNFVVGLAPLAPGKNDAELRKIKEADMMKNKMILLQQQQQQEADLERRKSVAMVEAKRQQMKSIETQTTPPTSARNNSIVQPPAEAKEDSRRASLSTQVSSGIEQSYKEQETEPEPPLEEPPLDEEEEEMLDEDDESAQQASRVLKPMNGSYSELYEGPQDDNNDAIYPDEQPPQDYNEFGDEPEPLSQHAEEWREKFGLRDVLDDYLLRCLHSKNWSLREAAIQKIDNMLRNGHFDAPVDGKPGLQERFKPIAGIVQAGLEDNVPQVYLATVSLLEHLLQRSQGRMPDNVVRQYMESITQTLVGKLGTGIFRKNKSTSAKLNDGSARIRDAASSALQTIARSLLRPDFVVERTMRLGDKQKSQWRPLMGRLHLLRDLVKEFGIDVVENRDDFSKKIMGFCKDKACFAHSSHEVRGATKQLTVAVQELVGSDALKPYLNELRPKQKEEYEAAFDANKSIARVQKISMKDGNGTPQKATPTSSPVRSEGNESGGGMSSNTASGKCMFCGREGLVDDEAMDMHHFEDCPLLCECNQCGQVIEVFEKAKHLMTECQKSTGFIECETTGLAVKQEDWDGWLQRRPSGLNEGEKVCPLCEAIVSDHPDEWRIHLMQECSQNQRAIA